MSSRFDFFIEGHNIFIKRVQMHIQLDFNLLRVVYQRIGVDRRNHCCDKSHQAAVHRWEMAAARYASGTVSQRGAVPALRQILSSG